MINIALDGPAGAGKSSVAKNLAKELNYIYLDTGAMYRAIALKLYNLNADIKDERSVELILLTTEIEIKHINGTQVIFLDKKDVSSEIRQHFVSKLASDTSALKCVRLKMVEMQRKIAASANMILDGRDIGSFVLPNANFKFFVTATVEERAKRRFNELKLKGDPTDLETVKNDIAQRDYNDMHRDFAPLVKAKDAIEIDTTNLTLEEVTQKILKIIRG